MFHIQHTGATRTMPAISASYRRRGFTLVELLVALVLLNVGLMALVALTAALSRMGNDTRATARAARAASARLERLQSFACTTSVAGFAEPLSGMSETFGDEPASNDTRRLHDSVAFVVAGGMRSVALETRARC